MFDRGGNIHYLPAFLDLTALPALFFSSCGRRGHVAVVLLVVVLLVVVLLIVIQLVDILLVVVIVVVFVVSRLVVSLVVVVVSLLVVTLVLLVDSFTAPCTFGQLLVSVGRLTLTGRLWTGCFLGFGGHWGGKKEMMWQSAATNKQAKQVCWRAELAELAGVADK